MVGKSDGSIYFTDPDSVASNRNWISVDVSRLADLGDIHVLVWDFVVPNGLAFSPDERILVNDSRRGHIRAFDVEPTGLLALATDRVFAALQDDRISVPDGMKVDVEGNVYCTGPGGIWILIRAARIWGR